MYVKNGDTLEELETILYDPGVGKIESNQLFKGWIKEKADYSVDDVDDALDIKEIREWAEKEPITGNNKTVTFYAMIFSTFSVSFKDEDGATIHGEALIFKPESDTDPSTKYLVNVPYTPKTIDQEFQGWNVEPATAGNVDATPPIANGTEVTLTGNVVFTAKAPAGHWLSFVENGANASYTPPVFVETGHVTETPAKNPTREGYTFGGWYTDKECTTAFEFGSELEKSISVYAKWNMNDTASYKVIIWKQNITGDGYDYGNEVITLNGTPQTTVTSVRREGTGDSSYAVINNVGKQYTGFHLDHFDEEVVIAPEGTTVVNVYYNRTEFTLTFIDEEEATPKTITYRYYGGTYSDAIVGAEITNRGNITTLENNKKSISGYNVSYYGGGLFSSRTYAIKIGDKWYQITRNGSYVYNADSISSVPDMETDTSIVKTIKALYQQDISTYFPIQGNNGKDYTGYVWEPQDSAIFTSGDVPSLDAMREENTVFHAKRYGSGITVHMYYYLESLPGESGDITYNGKKYEEHQHVQISSNGGISSTKDEDFYEIDGFTAYDSDPKYGSDGKVSLNRNNNYTIKFYYTRNEYTVNYMDGVYVKYIKGEDGTEVPYELDETNRGQLKVSAPVAYQASMSALGDFKPEYNGFVFEGWYKDAACTEPYDFSGTMPKANVTVYAKWAQIQYRVFLHPNIPSTEDFRWGDENQETSFRVDYGEKIADGTMIDGEWTDHSLIGWYTDEAFTQPFNFDAYVLNEDTVTTAYDKTQSTELDKYGKPIKEENSDAKNNRFWINKKFDLYAKWRSVLNGAKGIHVEYDATDKGEFEGEEEFYNDPLDYLDLAEATAAPASVAKDAKEQFLHWVVQEYKDGEFKDTEEVVFPGDTFVVKKSSAKVEELPAEEASEEVFMKYTVRLRAEYGPVGAQTPTHITWYPNFENGPDPITNNNLKINQAVDIRGASTFTRPGYEFVGWARMPEYDVEDTEHSNPITIHSDATVWLSYNSGEFTDVDRNEKVTQIAADERTPYHGMYAVWKRKPVTLTVAKQLEGSIEYAPHYDSFEIVATVTDTLNELDKLVELNRVKDGVRVSVSADEKTATITLTLDSPANVGSENKTTKEVVLLAGMQYEVTENGEYTGYVTEYDENKKSGDNGLVENKETIVINRAAKITPAGLTLNTTAAKTALLSLFAFAMMCMLGFSLKRRYVSRR